MGALVAVSNAEVVGHAVRQSRCHSSEIRVGRGRRGQSGPDARGIEPHFIKQHSLRGRIPHVVSQNRPNVPRAALQTAAVRHRKLAEYGRAAYGGHEHKGED